MEHYEKRIPFFVCVTEKEFFLERFQGQFVIFRLFSFFSSINFEILLTDVTSELSFSRALLQILVHGL